MYSDETKIYITLLIAGIILAIVIGFFLVTIIRYQKRSVRAYLDRMKADLSLLERERSRIASDIHDELGSGVSAIKLILERIDSHDDKQAFLIEKANTVINTMMLSIRQISNDMVPHTLQREGLFAALDELIEKLLDSSTITVSTDWKVGEEIISNEMGIHIYRIVQEILNNAIKHAHASRIHLSLQQSTSNIQLHITDNGIGFDKSSVTKVSEGLGLHNIMARVDVLRGSIYLTTEKGKGVDYLIDLPLHL